MSKKNTLSELIKTDSTIKDSTIIYFYDKSDKFICAYTVRRLLNTNDLYEYYLLNTEFTKTTELTYGSIKLTLNVLIK